MTTDTTKPQSARPTLRGTRHMVAAGHYMAAQAGLQMLEVGGNAIDAAAAAGIATAILEPEYVSFAGVAPILIYLAESQEVVTISGLGPWPRAASCAYFQDRHGGAIPHGPWCSVVPGAPDAWITALERYGTMGFGEVAAAAIRFAREGIAMYPTLARRIAEHEATYAAWPTTAPIFLPAGRPPHVGEIFVQEDLGRTLQFLADEEAAQATNGRAAGLAAVRRAFYRGDVAAAIVKFHAENGGLMTAADLADFRVGIEPPVKTRFHDIEVYGCGPWCQGPMLLQSLNIVEGLDLAALGHNTPAYIHALTEAIKLAAADRDAYYGDPRFVDVPMAALLDKDYAARRRALIRAGEAWIDRPPPGEAGGGPWLGSVEVAASGGGTLSAEASSGLDTSYLCVIDRWGNAVSATPSDGSTNDPIIPGTGLFLSPRGVSAWTDPDHPCSIAPGKRPRLTPNPALAIRTGDTIMPFGTPGGDVQTQAMLQVFLNIFVFGMAHQAAVEAPRFASYGFPSSFEPHDSHPGRVSLESRITEEVGETLSGWGHEVNWWPERIYLAGSVCAIGKSQATGILHGAADPRRAAYVSGW